MISIIDATTNAVTTPVDIASRGYFVPELPLTIAASGLSSGETVTVKFHNGSSWSDVYVDGVKVQLTDDNNMIMLRSGFKYGIIKDATTNPVAVMAAQGYG